MTLLCDGALKDFLPFCDNRFMLAGGEHKKRRPEGRPGIAGC